MFARQDAATVGKMWNPSLYIGSIGADHEDGPGGDQGVRLREGVPRLFGSLGAAPTGLPSCGSSLLSCWA